MLIRFSLMLVMFRPIAVYSRREPGSARHATRGVHGLFAPHSDLRLGLQISSPSSDFGSRHSVSVVGRPFERSHVPSNAAPRREATSFPCVFFRTRCEGNGASLPVAGGALCSADHAAAEPRTCRPSADHAAASSRDHAPRGGWVSSGFATTTPQWITSLNARGTIMNLQ
jgi:hypothetical protein